MLVLVQVTFDATRLVQVVAFTFGGQGSQRLSVVKDGVHIRGSPFTQVSLSSLGPTDSAMSDSVGNGLFGVLAGGTASFRVQAKNKYGLSKKFGGDKVSARVSTRILG